jgi:hypothetical protein
MVIGTTSAPAAREFTDPWGQEEEPFGHRSIANAHLEEVTPTPNAAEQLAAAAERLLGDVRETHYQHRTHVDAVEGVYDMDCSGFVDYLLKRVAPRQFAEIPIEPGHARPRAAVYFEFLHRLVGQPLPDWRAIRQLSHAQCGEIIAWELQASTQEPGDTGHVVIPARLRSPRRLVKKLFVLVRLGCSIAFGHKKKPPEDSLLRAVLFL